MFLQDSSESCQVIWSVSQEHDSVVIPCLMQLCILQPAPRFWLTSGYQKFILDSYPIYHGWYRFIEKSICGRQQRREKREAVVECGFSTIEGQHDAMRMRVAPQTLPDPEKKRGLWTPSN